MTVDTETLDRVVDFHGHMCPGLALGVRAAEVALAEIGPHSQDEEVVAIVETDMCGVDAVQFLTGCTFGKGNLLHRDHGKNVYTFVRRSDGKAIRVSGRPDSLGPDNPGWDTVFATIRTGGATPEDHRRFWEIQRERSRAVLAAPIDQLYDVRDVDVSVPPTARVFASVVCHSCGEGTMETRIRRLEGHELCPPCFDAALAGTAPVGLGRPRLGRSAQP
jgi:formylmethanofuran dehydrogenase subunit E